MNHATAESELSQHLIAELFAKTAQMLRDAHPSEIEAIVTQHDNHLVAIANATKLLLGRRDKSQPLRFGGRGYGFELKSGPPSEPSAESASAT